MIIHVEKKDIVSCTLHWCTRKNWDLVYHHSLLALKPSWVSSVDQSYKCVRIISGETDPTHKTIYLMLLTSPNANTYQELLLWGNTKYLLPHYMVCTVWRYGADNNLRGGGKESTLHGTVKVEPKFAPSDCFLFIRHRGASGKIYFDSKASKLSHLTSSTSWCQCTNCTCCYKVLIPKISLTQKKSHFALTMKRIMLDSKQV